MASLYNKKIAHLPQDILPPLLRKLLFNILIKLVQDIFTLACQKTVTTKHTHDAYDLNGTLLDLASCAVYHLHNCM